MFRAGKSLEMLVKVPRIDSASCRTFTKRSLVCVASNERFRLCTVLEKLHSTTMERVVIYAAGMLGALEHTSISILFLQNEQMFANTRIARPKVLSKRLFCQKKRLSR